MIKSNLKKKNEGITLIALVVSIIVMLILSAVSVSMISGDNGILRKTTEAKEATEKASAKEQVQVEVLGSFDAKTNQNLIVLKDRLGKIGAEVKNSDFPLYIKFKDNEYIISENGEITDLGNGGVTLLAKINAQVSEMNESEKLEFYQGFYGKTVNYQPKTDIQTSTEEANKSKKAIWKIFYADENNIYLIADSYVTYDSLPSSETVSFNRISEDNLYKANFNNSGLLTYYAGGTIKINSFSKANAVKALNKDFFYWKNPSTNEAEGLTGTNTHKMKAVAAMLDTDFWDTKYKDNNGYAEFTIGGPTIEMFLKSYNQSHGANYGAKAFKSGEKNGDDEIISKTDGYKISANADVLRTSSNWGNLLNYMISGDYILTINLRMTLGLIVLHLQ